MYFRRRAGKTSVSWIFATEPEFTGHSNLGPAQPMSYLLRDGHPGENQAHPGFFWLVQKIMECIGKLRQLAKNLYSQ